MPPFRAPLRALRKLALALALICPAPAAAEAAEFDHYILVLTWMPSFCALSDPARDDPRCAAGQAQGWLVHGLWPQGAQGTWPEYCPPTHRNPSRRETAAQADLFGAGGPAWHQWNKHGRCTGLSAADYFALTRAALGALALPEVPSAGHNTPIAPAELTQAIAAANPGVHENMMIATCRDSLIVELRLCLTRTLQPRACESEFLQRGCRHNAARLPPAP